jgi:hypothetical protein
MAEGGRVKHTKEHRHRTVLVRDDREVHLRVLCLVDIRDPALVVLRGEERPSDW